MDKSNEVHRLENRIEQLEQLLSGIATVLNRREPRESSADSNIAWNIKQLLNRKY